MFDLAIGDYEVQSEELSAVVVNVVSGKVVKRFRGESAWSDANRYATDLYFAEINGGK